jgi:hypothetical protein
MDTSYNIQTKSNGEIQIPFNTASVNGWTVGETASFTFEFEATQTLTEDYTVPAGETQSFEILFVPEGVTLTVDGTLNVEQLLDGGTVTGSGGINTGSGYLTALTDYVQWAGSWTTLEMLNSVVKYRMQFPDSAAIDSLVWGVTPNTDLADRNVVGVWGLVENIQNERNQALSINRYTVDVTVLAPIDDYADIDAVETDLVI